MLMKSEDGRQCAVYCSCGCDNGVVLKAMFDGDSLYELSLVSDIWCVCREKYGIVRLIEKCKRIWRILRGKEYHYFNICISSEDMKEFKEFVASIQRSE